VLAGSPALSKAVPLGRRVRWAIAGVALAWLLWEAAAWLPAYRRRNFVYSTAAVLGIWVRVQPDGSVREKWWCL